LTTKAANGHYTGHHSPPFFPAQFINTSKFSASDEKKWKETGRPRAKERGISRNGTPGVR